MRKAIFTLLAAMAYLSSCNDDDLNVNLDPIRDLSFRGTLKTIGSEENLSENVILRISNGHYECSTSLAFGYGAGKLAMAGRTIDFIDTAFFALPAMHGPSYVLCGEHHYKFDGENLKIWRKKNVGSIEYKLKLIK